MPSEKPRARCESDGVRAIVDTYGGIIDLDMRYNDFYGAMEGRKG